MKSLTRDITVTLIVKLSLLMLLWWVCFHGVEKPSKDARRWMLGASFSDVKSANLYKNKVSL